MRQHWAGGDVADREDARHSGLIAFIDDDSAALVEADAQLVGSQTVRVGSTADGNQQNLAALVATAISFPDFHSHTVRGGGSRSHRGSKHKPHALLFQASLQQETAAPVHSWYGAVHHLQHRDFAAESQ